MNERSFAKSRARRRGPGRPRADETAEHREKILRAAEGLFSKRGFHGTGLREVATSAGVSLGNIYNHFPTKELLFDAVLQKLEKVYLDPTQPLPRALTEIEFPGELEKLGHA